jgi:hypothetical protein
MCVFVRQSSCVAFNSVADVFQDDSNTTLRSLTSVPMSMILSDCMNEVVFVACLSLSTLSGISRCDAESFLGVASHNNLSLVSETGFSPLSSTSCRLSWRMYDQEFFSTYLNIFERVMYSSFPASVLFPNVQNFHIKGSNFSASQAMFQL